MLKLLFNIDYKNCIGSEANSLSIGSEAKNLSASDVVEAFAEIILKASIATSYLQGLHLDLIQTLLHQIKMIRYIILEFGKAFFSFHEFFSLEMKLYWHQSYFLYFVYAY